MPCPICKSVATEETSSQFGGRVLHCVCCGVYSVTRAARFLFEAADLSTRVSGLARAKEFSLQYQSEIALPAISTVYLLH